MNIDLLIHSASQLITCANPNGVKRRQAMSDVGLILDGAIAIDDGKIIAVGSTADIRADYTATETIDATDKVICPGFIDPHTHVVYGGDRVNEFEMRIKGATYMEIMAAGGGILNTMHATRSETMEQLMAESKPRLDTMLALGTTTIEVKSGYGLNTETELKMLQAIVALDEIHATDLVPTFLGGHAVPPEYKGQTDKYVDLVIEEMLPAVKEWHDNRSIKRMLDRQSKHGRSTLFCDVFCEHNVFDREQSKRMLQAGLDLGFPAKIHTDEFMSLGGVNLAVELGAVSADHLDVTPPDDVELLANSDTIGVILPAVNFNMGSTNFANARTMIDGGVALALSTDINPGSAPCPSMPLVMALACRYQRLLPSEAFNASTINAAHAIGLGDKVGSLEVGKQADVLVINTQDYRHVAYWFGDNLVEKVIKRGRII